MTSRLRIVGAWLLPLALSACAPMMETPPPAPTATPPRGGTVGGRTPAPDKPAEKPADKAPDVVTPLPAPSDARPVALAKFVGRLTRGQKIGTQSGGIFCIPQGPITWRLGANEAIGGDQMVAMREELKKNGYRVAGQSDSLFDDPNAARPEILIGGVVKSLTVNACSGPQGRKSDSTIDIEWQIYDTRTRSVVLTLPTTAAAKSAESNRDAYVDAYVGALRSLLASDKFVAAVRPRETGPATVEFPPIPVSVLTIKPPDLSRSAAVLICPPPPALPAHLPRCSETCPKCS